MSEPASSASPLTVTRLIESFRRAGLDLPRPEVFASVSSTNEIAVQLAARGAPEWSLVVTDYQTQGRGRLDRSWSAKPGTALLVSIVLRPPPSIPVANLGWIPLLAGLALADAVRALSVSAGLKWPNDLVVADAEDPRKLAGILAERTESAVVVGIGVNVTTDAADLPVPTATSLALEGAVGCDRVQILTDYLVRLQALWHRWITAAGDPRAGGLLDQYRRQCVTLELDVRVEMPGRAELRGRAIDVDTHGGLVVRTSEGQEVAVSAGDVTHIRRGA